MTIKTKKIMRYTIVEMMMVVAVFMIILSMAVMAWLNSGSQAKLKNAARLFSAQLNLAKAKAVTGREPVRLVFSTDKSTTKVEMFYGETGSDKPHDTEPFYLPGGIHFVTDKGESSGDPVKYAENNNFNVITPDTIVFAATGKLKTTDTNRRFYLMEKCPDGKVKGGQTYYIVTVNQFSGRINTMLETVP